VVSSRLPAASVYAVLFALAVVALGVFVFLSVGRGRSIYIFERGLVTTKGGAWSASRRHVAFRWEDSVLVGKPWMKGASPGPADDYFLVGPDGTKAFLSRDGRERVRYAMLRPRVRKVLTEVAAQRSTITYEQLSERVWRGIEDWAGSRVEGASKAVSIASDEAGEGLLNAVVVGRSGFPWPSWFEFAASRGRDVRDTQRAWRSEVERVWRTFAGPGSSGQQDMGG
jgi:hypothetical protein